MKISRLRLLGFKSFVEPTELVIEPGLTGVVGPNGCGKSNLLEALRWVMGETSHKSMRAAAMEDVIFSGTTSRPPRVAAEVTMFLDNTARQAPAELNDRDQIEITRRIEREAGSAYRINGREARARDIKILFEDAATGARSPALVRQGQIGEIVNAKPENRRRILEDAAGVAGLHSRRHEADLRLKAAEANLARITDVLGQVTSQIDSLKRQARQARRYKELSGEIRSQEALLFHLSWTQAQLAVETTEANLRNALEALSAALTLEARAGKDEAAKAEATPPLREEEARRAAALHRLKVELETFEREAKRATDRQQELEGRAAHLAADMAREDAHIAEARELNAGLDAEIEEIDRLAAAAISDETAANETRISATADLSAAEARFSAAAEQAADARARRRSLEGALSERQSIMEQREHQIAILDKDLRDTAARAPDAGRLELLTTLGRTLATDIAAIEQQTIAAEDRVRELAEDVNSKRSAADKARLAVKAIATERATLTRLLVVTRDTDAPAIVDELRVAAGYETALGAALGDDLDAPASEDAPVHWRRIEAPANDPALPAEAEPLARHVTGAPELTRRLLQVGVVPRHLGLRLQPGLRPGQRLVSREGDLWRWDGFVAAADGATAAAQRLAQKNRLTAIAYEEAEARELAETTAEAEAAAVAALLTAEASERGLRQSWRATQARLAETRDNLTTIDRAARETEARLATIKDARQRAEEDVRTARERTIADRTALTALEPIEAIEGALAAARTGAEQHRAGLATAQAKVAELDRNRDTRAARRRDATVDRDRWQARLVGATEQVSNLRRRAAETRTELDGLADLPRQLDARRQALINEAAKLEAERQAAADRLAEAETAHRESQKSLREAHAAVSDSRETRARIEAQLESARQRRQDEARRIRDSLGVVPEGCLPLAGFAPGAELPPLAVVESKLSKLKIDRERLGGVNLTADDDLATMSAEFETLDTERRDVEEAVTKLHGAINQLNREAKKRLDEAFDTVNAHFQRLFTTLFGGGEARLEMIAGEDPLEGGLEIIAKPPGKKPATLSLLSGGEQTLTALSLIFAVFLTNPSPICVLDEVDAPLDDANVDRFCTLMEKMAAETATRFLVITHHPMTMARMNRLFGVTMAEKGVSQLVSVNLEMAHSFLEAS